MIERVELVLGLFIILYLILINYDVVSLVIRKNDTEYENKKKKKIIDLLIKCEGKSKNVKSEARYKFYKLLSKISYLHALSGLIENEEKIKDKKVLDIIRKEEYVIIFSNLTSVYQEKDEIAKAYYAYFLNNIDCKDKKICNYLLDLINSNSLYAIENSISALAKSGNNENVIKAFQILSSHNYVIYNHRLVADVLLKYNGSKNVLCEKLFENFNSFNEQIKIGVLTLFRRWNYDIGDEIIKMLGKEDLEKELEIEMIRYFSKIINKKIPLILIDRIENNYYNDFEYEVVMLQVLANYKSEKTIKLLEKELSSSNFYVRYNAGKSLSKMIDLTTLEQPKDKFAKEMIESLISQGV